MFSAFFRPISAAILLAAALLSISSNAQQPASATNVWPFKKGNTWTFDASAADSATNKKTPLVLVITVSDVKKTPDGDEAIVEYHIGDKVTQTETYRTSTAGIVRTGGGNDGKSTLQPPLPLIKYPMKVGNKWDWKGTIQTPGGAVSGTAKYSVPELQTLKLAGQTMQAYRLHLVLTISQGGQSGDFVNDYWFVPNIGLVKQKLVVGTATIEGSLTKYSLAK